MYKLCLTLTFVFCAFILWVIYMANTGQSFPLFSWVRSIPYGDKIGHVVIYGLMTLGVNGVMRFRFVKWGSLLVASFALLEELSQYFVATRILDIGDLFADALGITVFTLISWYFSTTGVLRKKH